MKFKKSLAFLAVTMGFQVNAALVDVPYSGFFDEVSVAAEDGLSAGDFDTIGGLDDVAKFTLIEGVNEFVGSVWGPTDNADVFTVEIMSGYVLTSASILWGTNLPGIGFTYPPVSGYLQQNTYGASAASWYFEESSTTPEVFTVSGLEGTQFGEAMQSVDSPALNVMEGVYSSLLDATGTCAQTYVPDPNGVGIVAQCMEGIDYKMTFNVEALPGNPVGVPEPTTLGLISLSLLAIRRLRKR